MTDQPTPRAPEPEWETPEAWIAADRRRMADLAPREPSAPDDLRERLDRLYAGALRKHEGCRCPIGLAIRADYAAVMDVLRREGLVT